MLFRSVEPSPIRILLRASTTGCSVAIVVEKSFRDESDDTSTSTSVICTACCSLGVSSFDSLKAFLLLAVAKVPDLVIRGAVDLGNPAPSASPLVGGFGMWAESCCDGGFRSGMCEMEAEFGMSIIVYPTSDNHGRWRVSSCDGGGCRKRKPRLFFLFARHLLCISRTTRTHCGDPYLQNYHGIVYSMHASECIKTL